MAFFDPTKTDIERMCEKIDEKYSDAWVTIYRFHGDKGIKVEPPQGPNAKEDAESISEFLSDSGLNTNIEKISSEGNEDIYEVTATTEMW